MIILWFDQHQCFISDDEDGKVLEKLQLVCVREFSDFSQSERRQIVQNYKCNHLKRPSFTPEKRKCQGNEIVCTDESCDDTMPDAFNTSDHLLSNRTSSAGNHISSKITISILSTSVMTSIILIKLRYFGFLI